MRHILIAVLGLTLLPGCGGGEDAPRPPDPIPITSLTVFPSTHTLKIGETKQYTVSARDSNGNIRKNVEVAWDTGNHTLATINGSGMLTAEDDGTTTVRATHGGIKSQFVTVTITRTPSPPPVVPPVPPPAPRAQLPPWLTYCDGICNGFVPYEAAACPADDTACEPRRSTTVIPRVDGIQISGVHFGTNATPIPVTRLIRGDGLAQFDFLWGYHVPSMQFRSDLDVTVTSYNIDPVWGGTTQIDFVSTALESESVDTVFFKHPRFNAGNAANDLHAKAQEVIRREQELTGITTSEHVTAYFMPGEMVSTSDGEGHFSYGNGTVTVNYGSQSLLNSFGGMTAWSMARLSHEYAHELFDEISGAFPNNFACLNEGIADATAFVSGFLPVEQFGPDGVRGISFEGEERCLVMTEIHDIGNCSLWHVQKAGHLTPAFIRGLFHPQHRFVFDSCVANKETGDNLLVLFTEASGGTDMIPVLDATRIPHSPTYVDAKQALGLR